MSKRTTVKYELGGVRNNRRTREALGGLILADRVQFISATKEGDVYTVLLQMRPSISEEVQQTLRATSLSYQSPTYGETFHPPQSLPFYASPEDELNRQCTPTAKRQLDYWEEQSDQGRQ